MTSIALSEIPAFLRTGAFYKSLNLDDQNEVIVVPEGCFKSDASISDVDDFKALLNTVMYWGVDGLLPVFVDYCCANDPSVWNEAVSGIADCELRADLLAVSEASKIEQDPLTVSVFKGRTNLVEYFCAKDSTVRDESAVLAAIRQGRLDYVQLLHQKGFPISDEAFGTAVGHSQFECVKFIYFLFHKDEDDGSEDEDYIFNNIPHLTECAAKSGDAETLQFLLEKFDVDETDSAVFYAATEGHVDCLKKLHAAGATMDNLFDDSNVWFDPDVIKFLHEEVGLPLPDDMVKYFASEYDDERLRYGIEHSSTYDADEVLAEAIRADSDVCLKYLVGELHWPIADKIEGGQEFKARCKAYLEESGWLSTDANKKPRVD